MPSAQPRVSELPSLEAGLHPTQQTVESLRSSLETWECKGQTYCDHTSERDSLTQLIRPRLCIKRVLGLCRALSARLFRTMFGEPPLLGGISAPRTKTPPPNKMVRKRDVCVCVAESISYMRMGIRRHVACMQFRILFCRPMPIATGSS